MPNEPNPNHLSKEELDDVCRSVLRWFDGMPEQLAVQREGPGPMLIGQRLFTDGKRQSVYRDGKSNQYIIDDGKPVYGVWIQEPPLNDSIE